MIAQTENTKRIAKNTIFLYGRTIVTMLISLFTSRIILAALGIDNYGIANVVGGVVAMFSVISGSLSGSISRFLTFALGEGNKENLRKLFSISINIQILIGLIILVVGEIGGIWFLNNKLNIPPDRLLAAHWVLQCSLLNFFVGLISVPYNACIIAHEKMDIYAYMTIVDVSIKLLFAYILYVTPFDVLITYIVSQLIVVILMRIFYGIYCTRKFEECRYEFTLFDKNLAKEMFSFAWWGFFGNTAWMFNTQGVNIAINMFFGVTFNAARGVAGQVEGAVMSFIGNFTTALNPQITKSYAAGDREYLFQLISKGAKFSFFLMLFFIIPVAFESETLLRLWLGDNVPPMAPLFVVLSLLSSVSVSYGNTAFTAIMATGNIRNYQIWITLVGCLVFPLTWLGYKLGLQIQSTYYIFIFIYCILVGIRILFLKKLMDFPPMSFIKNAVLPNLLVTFISLIGPSIIVYFLEPTFGRLIVTCCFSVLSIPIIVYFIGLTKGERSKVTAKIEQQFPQFKPILAVASWLGSHR